MDDAHETLILTPPKNINRKDDDEGAGWHYVLGGLFRIYLYVNEKTGAPIQ